MTVIESSSAPAAIGPYSQAIDTGSMIFVSGQLPIDPKTGEMPSEVSAQTRQSMENLKAILETAGSSLEHAVKATIFLQNLEHFAAVNEVYASYFSNAYPARSCVQVARLPKDALVEIEIIALKK